MKESQHPRFDPFDAVTNESQSAHVPTHTVRALAREIEATATGIEKMTYGSLVPSIYMWVQDRDETEQIARAIEGMALDHPFDVDVEAKEHLGNIDVTIERNDEPVDHDYSDVGPDEPAVIDPSFN